jgi:kanamycin kinase
MGAPGQGHVSECVRRRALGWADLAIATWSTAWNYGPGWLIPLLQAHGVQLTQTAHAATACRGI